MLFCKQLMGTVAHVLAFGLEFGVSLDMQLYIFFIFFQLGMYCYNIIIRFL